MRCELNSEMSGEFAILRNDGEPGSAQLNPTFPLAKNIDELNIYINHEGSCVIAESGGGVMLVSDGVSNWMVSKQYCPTYCENEICVLIFPRKNGQG